MNTCEARQLRSLAGAFRRPSKTALYWLWKLLPWSKEAAKRKVNFVVSILRDGPAIEKEAMREMMEEHRIHKSGWWSCLLIDVKKTRRWKALHEAGLLTKEEEKGILGPERLEEIAKAIKKEAIEAMRSELAREGSKHNWLVKVIPSWGANRLLFCLVS